MQTPTYEKVPLNAGDVDDESVSDGELSQRELSRKRRGRWVPWAIGLSLCAGVVIGSAGSAWIQSWRQASSTSCFRQVSAPTPITHDVEIQYHWQQFEGNFLDENVYRRHGSPEVDEAWEALGINYRAMVVPEELAEEAGIAPDQVKINHKYGGGYPANVEGLHHLHCLNLLRQSLYYNIDYYRAQGKGAFENEEPIVQKHVSHCVDIIRQQLMCTVDTGVLGQVWYQPKEEAFPSAFVDFNTRHVCRNFDAIRDWAEKGQMKPIDELPNDWLEPPKPEDRIYDHVP